MAPVLAGHYEVDHFPAHAIGDGQRIYAHTAQTPDATGFPGKLIGLSYRAYLRLCQFGSWILVTTQRAATPAPFALAIRSVIRLRALKEMRWPNTSRIVTAMQHALRRHAVMQLPGYTVSQDAPSPASTTQPTVTPRLSANPNPTRPQLGALRGHRPVPADTRPEVLDVHLRQLSNHRPILHIPDLIGIRLLVQQTKKLFGA